MLTLRKFHRQCGSFLIVRTKRRKLFSFEAALLYINFYDACVCSISNRTLPPISTSLKHSGYYAQSHELSNGIFNTFTYNSVVSLPERA